MADTADRSIAATPRRREQARRAGLEPSATFPAWASSAATAIVLVPAWARATIPAATEALREAVASAAMPGEAAGSIPVAVVMPSLGLIAASAAAGMAVHVATGGISFQPSRATIDPARVDPLAGLRRIFSGTTVLGMLGHAIALTSLVTVAFMATRPLAAMLAVSAEPGEFAEVAWKAMLWLALGASLLAVVQWFLSRRSFEQRIMMTPQEFADEAKDLRADPRVRLMQQKRTNSGRVVKKVPEPR